MKKMTRALSVMLAILMVAGSVAICIPATVSASPLYEGSGRGTVATEADTKAVEDAVPYTELPTGGWVTPNNDGLMDDMLKAYQGLSDAGLNYMVTVNELYSKSYMSNAAYCADKVGMDLFVNPIYTAFDYDYSEELMQIMADFPAVKGYWFGDEPHLDNPDKGTHQMSAFIERSNKLMALLEDYNYDFKYGANLLPTYASDISDYEGYVSEFVTGTQKYEAKNKIDKLSSDFVCFDYYPSYTGSLSGLINNLAKVKAVADENGIEMYSYIKNSGGENKAQPTDLQIQCCVNTNLALGVKSIMYYVACQSSASDAHTAIINYDGSHGTAFDCVKNINTSLDAMKGVYLSFENEGIMTTDAQIASGMNSIHPEYLHNSYKQVSSFSATNALIGCFTKGEDDAAQTGLYVVNQNYSSQGSDEVTLNLDSMVSYQIWGSNGLEQMGTDSKLVLNVASGDSKFVILNSVNDPSGYTPVTPEPERTPLPEARQNSLVFDLGYDDQGNIYNKLANGVGLVEGAHGTYTTVDDMNVLTDYNFRTLPTGNVSPVDCGITVEMYIKFTAKDSNDVYRDTLSNFNLFRWADDGELWFGMASGIDVQVGKVERLLPQDQWLHVITTQSDLNQAMYVNGNKVAVGGHVFDPTFISSIMFDGSDTVFLKDLRVFSYGVDQAEATRMYNEYMGEPVDVLGGFEDLEPGAWYEGALQMVVRHNLFGGIAEGVFAPDNDMTRSMFVTVLSRLHGVNLDKYTPSIENPFTDVTEDQWFYKAVMWAYENELVNGMTEDTFGPDGKITREQMCVLMVRFAEKYNYDLSETTDPVTFEDEGLIGSWALEAVKTCQKAGLVTGMTATTFVPGGNATRAQVAIIFTRLMAK